MTDIKTTGKTNSVPSSAKHVVVIDDDDMTLERIRRMLRTTDWVVDCYLDPEDARDGMEHGAVPAVLIVDNRMPRIDGIDFLTNFLSESKKASDRIFLCSSMQPPEDVCSRAQALGVGILSKDTVWDEDAFLDLLENRQAA